MKLPTDLTASRHPPIKTLPRPLIGEPHETTARSDFEQNFNLHRHAEAGPRKTKIHIENLDFFYGKTKALTNVTLDIPEKRVMALIGPSGCGKSTLLRVLNRMYDLYPDQHATGEVTMNGGNIIGHDVDIMGLRERVGMVFQTPTPFVLSIFDNVAFGIRLHQKLSRRDLRERVEQCLIKAALWPEVKDRLGTSALALSGGQQQRLCIARAIAIRPEVILLDEPTSALDPTSTQKVEDLIDELRCEYTIVIVTHSMQQAARCGDMVAFMYLGEMIELGTAAQIFTAPHSKQTEAYVSGRFG